MEFADAEEIKMIPCKVIKQVGYHDIHKVGEIINVQEHHMEDMVERGFIEVLELKEKVKMRKYILLYNVNNINDNDKKIFTDIQRFIGEENCLFQDYCLYKGDKRYIGESFWVSESHYILAWSLTNFDFLRTESEYFDADDFKLERAYRWLELNKDNIEFK